MGGISVWQLVIVLGIVILLFGTKKLRNIGSDLGGAIKGFKSAVSEGEQEAKSIEKKEQELASSTQKKETSKVES